MFAVLQTNMENLPLLSLYHASENTIESLSIQTSLARTTWNTNSQLLFVSFQQFNDNLQASFSELGLDANELAGTQPEQLQDQLMSFDPFQKSYRKLINIPTVIGVKAIELAPDGKQLTLLTNEDVLRTIMLEK